MKKALLSLGATAALLLVLLFCSYAQAADEPPKTADGKDKTTETKQPTDVKEVKEEKKEAPKPDDKVKKEEKKEIEKESVKEEVNVPNVPVDLNPKTPIVKEKEQLKFFQLDGYYRMRYQLFHRLDLGQITPLAPYPKDCYSVNKSKDSKCGSDLFSGANMRLSLNPTINVSEDVKLVMRVDVMDNLVLGSTPDTLDFRAGSPNSSGYTSFASTAVTPRYGMNSWQDAIAVKSLYGDVRLPFGVLRFGRMASQFGLGINVNNGSGINSDYGDFVDRVMFATKLFEHLVFVTWDMPNNGITAHNGLIGNGQEKNLTMLDDVGQWTFGFAKKDKQEDIDEKLHNGELVLNYGILNVLRNQNYEIPAGVTNSNSSYGTPTEKANVELVDRGLFLYILDVWGKLLYENLRLEFEGVLVTGSVDNIMAQNQDPHGCDFLQYGFVVQADYGFLDNKLVAGLELGMASGDPDMGWGVYPVMNNQDNYSGGKQFESDHKITNFRFDPDYRVDMLLFREIIGTVTDALYFKGVAEFRPATGLSARLEGIYSMALNAASVPYYASSFSQKEAEKAADSKQLGFELDLHITYTSSDKYYFGVSYGILFPGAGLGKLEKDPNNENLALWHPATGVAQAFQAMAAIIF